MARALVEARMRWTLDTLIDIFLYITVLVLEQAVFYERSGMQQVFDIFSWVAIYDCLTPDAVEHRTIRTETRN